MLIMSSGDRVDHSCVEVRDGEAGRREGVEEEHQDWHDCAADGSLNLMSSFIGFLALFVLIYRILCLTSAFCTRMYIGQPVPSIAIIIFVGHNTMTILAILRPR